MPAPRLLIVLAALSLAASAPAADPAPPAGFTPLFNGKDLSGWHGWAVHEKGAGPLDFPKLSGEERAKKVAGWTADAGKHWSVQNGELVNDGGGAYLATDSDLGDVELVIEYRTVAGADSGVYLRATPQVQIWDTTDASKFPLGANLGSGGLWNNSKGAAGKDPLAKADTPFGEWNRLRILQVGARTTVYLNGQLVVDHAVMENFWDRTKPLPVKGPVLLQTHGGEIRWRNLCARDILPAEANRILAEKGGSGFAPVFDGKSLTGWAGPTENYEVRDGAIVCKPGKGGTIYTQEVFTDFAARVEYKLPPGGNNGLAIRYPGSGDPAYVGMCEVQILDDTAAQYSKLDPRQYNGSVYGMIPVQRGYLRPVGEWNSITVTVRGLAIGVELNGTPVLSGDVSKVTEYMAKSPHPGKDRPAGHLGFAGHNDPVAFRNVVVKPLGK